MKHLCYWDFKYEMMFGTSLYDLSIEYGKEKIKDYYCTYLIKNR